MLFVDILAAGIDDERKILAAMTDHQIIDDSAAIVREKPIALPSRHKAQDVDRHHTLKSPRGIGHFAGTWP